MDRRERHEPGKDVAELLLEVLRLATTNGTYEFPHLLDEPEQRAIHAPTLIPLEVDVFDQSLKLVDAAFHRLVSLTVPQPHCLQPHCLQPHRPQPYCLVRYQIPPTITMIKSASSAILMMLHGR